MIERIPGMVTLLDTFGPFARPFLNMALENERLDYTWKKYLSSLKFTWKNEFHQARIEVEKGLRLSKKEGSTHYILLSKKLFFLMMEMKYTEGDLLYSKLLRDEAKIPPAARKYVMPILLGYRNVRKKEENVVLRRVRIWSKKYADDYGARMLLLLRRAHEKVESGKYSEGFSFLLESFRIASDLPHPLGIADALNDMAWYIRDKHPCWAYEIANRALYQIGWYRENLGSIFYALDTLFECQKLVATLNVYKSAIIMKLVSEHLPKGLGRKTKLHYEKKIEECEKIIPHFEISKYKNTDDLRQFIAQHVSSLTNASRFTGIGKKNMIAILKGRTHEIKGETVCRLLNIVGRFSPLNAPFPFWNERVKYEIEKHLLRSFERFRKMDLKHKKMEFLSTYMAYFDRRKSLSYLSGEERLLTVFNALDEPSKFESLMSKKFETKEFVVNMIEGMHPFLEARKDLIKRFLSILDTGNSFEKYTDFYINVRGNRPFLRERKRECLDRFARDYSRYDMNWGRKNFSLMRSYGNSSVPYKLKNVIQELNLKRMPSFLAYYALEEENERKSLLNVLKEMLTFASSNNKG